jgi:hypothetical protein
MTGSNRRPSRCKRGVCRLNGAFPFDARADSQERGANMTHYADQLRTTPQQQLPKRKANPRFQSLSCKPGAVWGQSGEMVSQIVQTAEASL